MLTTHEAAALLGVSVRRVQALITAGKLIATRRGRDWFIDRDSVLQRKGDRPMIDTDAKLYEVMFDMPQGVPAGRWDVRAITISQAATEVRNLMEDARIKGREHELAFSIARAGELGWMSVRGSTVVVSDEPRDQAEVAYFRQAMKP